MLIVEDLTESLNLVENSHLFFIDTSEVCQPVIYGRNLNCSLVRYSLYHNFCDWNIDTPQVSLEVE